MAPAYVALSFEFDEKAAILYAVLTHAESLQVFDQNAIESLLREHGYLPFHREDDAFALLHARMEKASEGRLEFSRRLDADVAIKISADKMQAHLTIRPAYGGAALDNQKVFAACQSAGIDPRFYGGDVIVPRLVNGPPVIDQLLAEGVPVVHGSNATLTSLVRETASKKTQEDSHGKIDPHHALNQFIVVEAGTALMHRQPATLGSDGYDVCGTALIAKAGKDIDFSTTLSGAGIDPQDPNLLVALIKGHPVLLPNAVKVDPVLHLQEVGIKTGNIDFDGAISVDGDVHPGMVIRASSSVYVNGLVEKATIIAGHDIVVSGGVVGGDSIKDGKKHVAEEQGAEAAAEQHHAFKSFLKAGGSIKAKYINQAEIACDGDLVVAEYLMHSTAEVHGHVLLGQSGGKGCLIGGHCHASKGLAANVLGNEHYQKTHVSIGLPREKLARIRELLQEQEKQAGILAKLREGLDKMMALISSGNLGEELQTKIMKMENAIPQVSAAVEKLDGELATLQPKAVAGEVLQAVVTQHTFANVTLGINGTELRMENESGNGCFQLHSGKIKFSNPSATHQVAFKNLFHNVSTEQRQ